MLATSSVHNLFMPPKSYIRDLWRICLPLMLSSFSGTLMIFLDRIVLARYETHAMIAATTATNIFLIFQFGATSTAMIAEVFVGQFNGARQWDQVSKPVWQMIWFSFLCGLILIPIGLFGDSWFIPAEFEIDGRPYFRWLMFSGPIFPLVSALSAFYIGRGEVKIVTYSVILGNIFNLILVFAFVYGVPGVIQPQGAKGAAIATGIAELLVATGLFIIFLNPENRQNYHSHHWKLDLPLFLKCIQVGFPNAVGHVVSAAAWAMVMYLLAKTSYDHVAVMSIGLSLWVFFSFITDGLQKGITALASNYLGARKFQAISDILKAGLWLQFGLAAFLAIPLVIMPDLLVNFFIPPEAEIAQAEHLKELTRVCCRWLWIAYLFDGMAWVVDGVLTAAGDTRFVMFMNSIGTWVFCIVPIYLFIVKWGGSPITTLQVITVFCFILFFSYYWRYKSNQWQNRPLITT